MKNSLKVGSAFVASVLLMGCAKSVDDSPFVKRQVLLGDPSTAIGSTTINIFDAGYKYGHQEIVVNFDKIPYGVKFNNCNDSELENCPSEIKIFSTGFKSKPVTVDVNVTYKLADKIVSEDEGEDDVKPVTLKFEKVFTYMSWGEQMKTPEPPKPKGEGVQLVDKEVSVSIFKKPAN
ncbi:hypothetical protein [Vibrio owensii]|uniref:Lipoprotein n=1 Tax=Vibrio owensii CAIM 1854 = LMG 25443 TaxID=1229493 RepID=A0A0C1ZB40_9VIBR|nr:hypothetical protein [Vibrio owensii]KIF53354.1 hypothetical protein H735_10555 [Vibrio owensii CAIM 1854 = LMG 25443]